MSPQFKCPTQIQLSFPSCRLSQDFSSAPGIACFTITENSSREEKSSKHGINALKKPRLLCLGGHGMYVPSLFIVTTKPFFWWLWRSLIRTLLQRIHKTAGRRVEMGRSCLPVTSIQVLMLLIFPNSIPKGGNAQAQHKINMPLEITLHVYQH